MKIKHARSVPIVSLPYLRHKAVNAVLNGAKQVKVAKLFGVTRQSVGKCRKEGGYRLEANRRGRPKGGSLLPWHIAQIAKKVIDRTPEQLRMPFFLWTRESFSQPIEERFGIRFSLWTVGRNANHSGFTSKKAVRKDFERDPEAVRRWIEEECPEIMVKARGENATIYFPDKMGLRSNHAVGHTYGVMPRKSLLAEKRAQNHKSD